MAQLKLDAGKIVSDELVSNLVNNELESSIDIEVIDDDTINEEFENVHDLVTNEIKTNINMKIVEDETEETEYPYATKLELADISKNFVNKEEISSYVEDTLADKGKSIVLDGKTLIFNNDGSVSWR